MPNLIQNLAQQVPQRLPTPQAILASLQANIREFARQLPQAAQIVGDTAIGAAKQIPKTLSKQYLYDPQTKRVLPQSGLYPEYYQEPVNTVNEVIETGKVSPKNLSNMMPMLMMTTAPTAMGSGKSIMAAEAAKRSQAVQPPSLIRTTQGYMTLDEKQAFDLLQKGMPIEQVAAQTNMDAMAKASRRLRGEGLIPDFENALNTGDKTMARVIAEKIMKAPQGQNVIIDQYKKTLPDIFQRSTGVKLPAIKTPPITNADPAMLKHIDSYARQLESTGGVTATNIIPEQERKAIDMLMGGANTPTDLYKYFPPDVIQRAKLRVAGQGIDADISLATKQGNTALTQILNKVKESLGKQVFNPQAAPTTPIEGLDDLTRLAEQSKTSQDFINKILELNKSISNVLNSSFPPSVEQQMQRVQAQGFPSLTDFWNALKSIPISEKTQIWR